MLKALAAPLVSKPTNGWHSSFTAWTTRVSNPVCSPRFRVSASVIVQEAAFATGVPPDIYEFHLYPRNSEQRSHPLYYRGCWHRVSRCLLRRYRQERTVSCPFFSSLPTELYNPK